MIWIHEKELLAPIFCCQKKEPKLKLFPLFSPSPLLLTSQDALEVMMESESGSVSTDLTDLTLVSEDTCVVKWSDSLWRFTCGDVFFGIKLFLCWVEIDFE